MTRYVAHMVLICDAYDSPHQPSSRTQCPSGYGEMGKAMDLGDSPDSVTNHLCDLGKAAPLL